MHPSPRHRPLFFVLLALLGSSLIPVSLVQAESVDNPIKQREWNAGLSLTWKQSPFVGGKDQSVPRPVFLRNDEFNIRGPAWVFAKQPQRELYMGVGFDDWDHQRGKSPELRDMDTLDRAINLRAGGSWKIATGTVSVEIAQDIKAHKGQQLRSRYTFNPAAYNANLRPYAELQWQSAKMVDYYVGVKPHEVTANRPAYKADDALVLKTGIGLKHPLGKRLTAVAGVEASFYSDTLTKSPIIEDDHSLGAYAGFAYRW